MHFESQAAIYAGARPPDPPELWDRLRQRGLLQPGRAALDLGAGTGQATGPLLAAGLRVTAVEPGPQLAAQLRAQHPGATVVVARAEDADLGGRRFDLIVAATSIHWMDLDVLLPRVHQLLAPGGRFVVWRHVFGDADVTTPFRTRLDEIVRDRGGPQRSGFDLGDLVTTRGALTRTGLFRLEEQAEFRWSVELDDGQVHRLFSTFSDWSAEEVDRAAAAVRELGGRVVEHYQSWLLVLRPEGGLLRMTTNPPAPLRVDVADERDRSVLEQLWTMFRHDMSPFSGALPDADGRFRQERLDAALADADWCAYLFRLTEAPVGLALVRGVAGPERVINSFFLVHGARRSGHGRTAVRMVTARHPGSWTVAFQEANAPAAAFWRRVADDLAAGPWQEERRPVPDRPDLSPDSWISFRVG